MEWSNLEKDKKEFKKKMLTSERELQDLKEKFIRLEEDENVSSRRRKRAEERCEEVYKIIGVMENEIQDKDEKLEVMQRELLEVDQRMAEMKRKESEADKTVEELGRMNKMIGLLENQIVDKDEKLVTIRQELLEADQRMDEMRLKESEADRRMEEIKRKESEANKAVEELGRRNIEDLETIKRLRNEISATKKEKMSFGQSLTQMRIIKSEEADHDQEMEFLRKQNCEASDTIGKLRPLLIAAEMGKESSDRIIKETRCKLMEAEGKVNELTRQNLEAVQHIEDLKRLLLAADFVKKEMKDKESEADQRMEEMKRKETEANRTVQELGRRNIEDLETIKRLRNEILATKKEKMSLDQTLMQMRSIKSEEVDNVHKMEHLRKKIQDSSDIIGNLRHQLIASQMAKEGSDRTTEELRCRLLEADRKVDELTCQNLESVQNMDDLKRLLLAAETEKKKSSRTLEEMKDKQSEVDQLRRDKFEALKTIEELNQQISKATENVTTDKNDPMNLTNPTKEVGDANKHACNASSKRGREKSSLQTYSKKLKKANVINVDSSYTDCGNDSPKLMSNGIIEPILSFSSSATDDSDDPNWLMSGSENLTLQTSSKSKKLRKANIISTESSDTDCRNGSPNLMLKDSHFKHKDNTFEISAEKMAINRYRRAKSGGYYKLHYRSSLLSILNFLEVRKTKKVQFTEAHYKCMMKTAFGEFLVPFMKDEINVDYIAKNDVQLNRLLTTYNKELDCFVIGGQMMKITPLECQLIFGLKSGDKNFNIKSGKNGGTRPETGLVRRRFSNVKGRISLTVMKSKLAELLEKKNPNKTDIEDVTRIIILQSMAMFFFTTTCYQIPWPYFNYVEDLKKTTEYNWAAEITKFFMHYVKTQTTDPGRVKGCGSLLMYWFCEKSKEMVQRIINEPDIPRFRKWSLPEITNKLSELSSMENIESSQVSRYELVPTTLEREQLGHLASEPEVSRYELVPTLEKEQLGHLVSEPEVIKNELVPTTLEREQLEHLALEPEVSRYELVPTLEKEQLGHLVSEPEVISYELVPILEEEQLGHLVPDV